MLGVVLFVLTIIAAFFDWYVSLSKNNALRKLSKPAPMVLLLITIWVLLGGVVRFPMGIFMFGIFFGLVGDVLLLFEGEDWFVSGLIAFLLGHVCYIIGFNVGAFELNTLTSILMLLPIGLLMVVFLNSLLPNVDKSIKRPVAIYGIIILTMFYSSLLTLLSPTWNTTASVLAALGGAFFVLSDGMLGWDRFISPLPGIWVIMTYHLAQLAIAAAALIQFA